MEQLKPCPFCGGEVSEKSIVISPQEAVGLYKCWECSTQFTLHVHYMIELPDVALRNAWNRRPKDENNA